MVSIAHLLQKRRGFGGGRSGGGGSRSGGSRSGGSSSSGSSSSSSKGSSSSSGSSGGSSTNSGARTGRPAQSISPYNNGGGTPRTIAAGVPFAGRQYGGLPRSQIYSGYGYGGGYGGFARGAAIGGVAGLGFGYVGGLGFPYGMWPLYYGPHYWGDDEYGPHTNDSRPGGALMAASFSPPGVAADAPPQYLIYGDSDSVSNMTDFFATDCDAYNVVAPTAVDDNGAYPSGTNTTLLPRLDPSHVLAYYRASSFALYSFFEDTPSNPNATVNYTEPISTTPYLYPASARNSTFEQCLNQSLTDSLPIAEGYVDTSAAATSLPVVAWPLVLLLSLLAAILPPAL